MVRRADQRAEALRRLGAEVVVGDLTDLASMHRAIKGCRRIYFGMSTSAAYLEATVNTAAVARHYGVEAFVNMSQMTVSQMNIRETTDSPQPHWLSEQALSWSGLPIVTVRPTVFLEGFLSSTRRPRRADFRHVGAAVRRRQDLTRLGGRRGARGCGDPRRPCTAYRTNLRSDGPRIGRSGPRCAYSPRHSADPSDIATSQQRRGATAFGRRGFRNYVVRHLSAMAELTRHGRYDRMTDTLSKLTRRSHRRTCTTS